LGRRAKLGCNDAIFCQLASDGPHFVLDCGRIWAVLDSEQRGNNGRGYQ